MTSAKNYIYRNLHKNKGQVCSVRHRNVVVDYITTATLHDCEFRIQNAGQQRARENKQRNVHAFICCGEYKPRKSIKLKNAREISYNPFKSDTFFFVDTNEDVIGHYDLLLLHNGKVYLP